MPVLGGCAYHLRVPMTLTRTAALCFCLLCSLPALAQMATPQQEPNCADFRRNPDGSWSPTTTFTTNGVTLDPSWHFYPGQVYGSTDVVGMLNQRCVSAAPSTQGRRY